MESASEGAWSRLQGQGTNRKFYLPRLPQEYYQGDAVVHWTLTIAKNRTGWLNDRFHVGFREIMLHASARQALVCPVYCLMPDHLHLMWMGLQKSSNQRKAMKFLREYLQPQLNPFRFQHQPHDHVLRDHERTRGAFEKVCSYIVNNPVDARLIEPSETWNYIGAIVPGYPTFHPTGEGFWNKFWKVYFSKRASDAGNIRKPPI